MTDLVPRDALQPTGRTGGRHGLVVAASVLLPAGALALAGAGSVVHIAFPVLAVLAGAALLARRDGAFLEYTLWLWFLTPELRRMVDAGTGWHPISPIMAVAPVVSCLALLPALARPRGLRTGGSLLFFVALACLTYGAAVGALVVGPAPAAAGLLNWLPPVALGLYVAQAGPSTQEIRRVLRRTAALGVLVLGAYALVQFFVLPEWDRFWMANAELASIGRPEPLEVRVFSVLNSPGPFATVLAALLTLLLGMSGPRRTWVFPVGLVALGLSLVRGAWLALAVSVALLLRRSGARGAFGLVAVLALPVVLVASFGGPIADVVQDRVDESSQEGAQDDSLQARLELYRTQTAAVLVDPVGKGLGSVGTATKIGNNGQLGANANFDSGLLEYPYTFGALVGTVFLSTLLVVAALAWARARVADDFTAAAGAAMVGLVLQLVFVNITTAVTGVMLWVLLGLLLRRDGDAEAETTSSDAASSPGAPAGVR